MLFSQAWLHVSYNAPHVLKHAPEGERIRILAGTILSGQLVCGHALHVVAEPGVKLTGQLYLQGGSAGSPATREEEMATEAFALWEQAVPGTFEGLTIAHFMEGAVFVRGGSWQLRERAAALPVGAWPFHP